MDFALEPGEVQVAMGIDEAREQHRISQIQNPNGRKKNQVFPSSHLENLSPLNQNKSVL
jgi:hypothetical protein